jgi:hypothetical protein
MPPVPRVPAPESSDANATFCAAVLRGAAELEEPKDPKEREEPEDEEPEDDPAMLERVLVVGFFVDVVPSDDPAMVERVLVVGFFAAVVVAGFFAAVVAAGFVVEAMALRCATVTVPPVGVLVVFGFEAVPVVGRYRPPPTYIVAISMLLDRDGQCTHGPRRRQAGWSDICVVGENDLEDVGVAIDFTNNKANGVIGQARQIQPAAAQHSREICKACVVFDPAV